MVLRLAATDGGTSDGGGVVVPAADGGMVACDDDDAKAKLALEADKPDAASEGCSALGSVQPPLSGLLRIAGSLLLRRRRRAR